MADENTQQSAPDPIAAMLAIDDEQQRGRPLPEAELNAEAPADKAARERDEAGKFKGKEGDEKPDAKKPDEKKPDAKAEDKPEEKKPADMVPLAKFLEQTNRLKEQLDAKDITLKEFEKKLAAIEAKLPKPETPAEPDFIENPKEYVDHKVKGALEAIAEANKKAEDSGKKVEATVAEQRQREHVQQVMTTVQAQEREFIAQNPDYYDALAHIRQIRVFQLREFNPQITDDQIKQVITHEETNLAAQLLAQGKNPSATAYQLAQRYGYQKKAVDPNAGKQPDNVAKLPDVPNKRLPPDQTLGSGSAPADPDVYKPGEVDPVDTAIASLFKKRA
jgi:hypothetical protein